MFFIVWLDIACFIAFKSDSDIASRPSKALIVLFIIFKSPNSPVSKASFVSFIYLLVLLASLINKNFLPLAPLVGLLPM
jgi:hypothetical protein